MCATNKNHENIKIPSYIINVKERTDRLNHIKQQFLNKPEFDFTIVEAVKAKNGALGLWKTTLTVVKNALEQNQQYILLCEDDHEFTKNYSIEKLRRCILEAQKNNADVLLGGIHWFNSTLKIGENLFWVDKFTATQFVIIYQKFYRTLLDAKFTFEDQSDLKISDLTHNKLVIFPFISTQKEFGYSDINQNHNAIGYLSDAFNSASQWMDKLNKIREFYLDTSNFIYKKDDIDLSEVQIPTFLVCSGNRKDAVNYIKAQFEDKHEFETFLIRRDRQDFRAEELINTHRKIITDAMVANYDVIIICDEDHHFTSAYSKEFLFTNILEADIQGADLLFGSSEDIGLAVPLTANRFWVNQVLSTHFIVVFRRFFDEFINLSIRNDNPSLYSPSIFTDNKMVLFPAISKQRSNGDSNLSSSMLDLSGNMIIKTTDRLNKISKAYLKLNKKS